MLITIIPFLLSSSLNPTNSSVWKNGAEITFFIENSATKNYLDDSQPDLTFNLKTKLVCQVDSEDFLHCRFFETEILSSYDDRGKRMRFITEQDLWIKQNLEENYVEIKFDKVGRMTDVTVPPTVHEKVKLMILFLVRHLDIGVDFSTKIFGTFDLPSNKLRGNCTSKVFVTEGISRQIQNPRFNLILKPYSKEPLQIVLEISQKVDDKKCENSYDFFSFFASRDKQSEDIEAELKSASSHIIIRHSGFSSFSVSHVMITDHKNNTKYMLNESTSVSLEEIAPATNFYSNKTPLKMENNNN